ncbi:type II toxin-antitoxin system RelE/ParE family toxin [Aliiglaciecola sp. 3_MG-2023]|uniref:type II toxin-antitoxin system RelE/ParE family toxin n=1 Tax=Aliiglaciecola sp. 3_MG-2023 TaxID=3062644 RepID=UPI0026E19F1A|nr:type II toxin-antitoxin system RelE/ParE family toxin [Aliiglaciecola sp. 3_MG-2023]MDO6694195.1 type II toxin-antitoxin system RelE/ParE family toxin [Aliiglaciecola sp. 3_MG-2023]
MSEYRLTLAAEMDLADILEYGEVHFGTEAALGFYEGLLSLIRKIVNNPAQFARIDEVRKGYRRAIYQTYSVYFIERENFIEITRVIRKYPIKL